jgi:hypothetical protein
MAKKLTKQHGPFHTTHKPHFEQGKDRDIEVILYPKYVQVRAIGIGRTYHVPYGVILLKGAEMETTPRIRRGTGL